MKNKNTTIPGLIQTIEEKWWSYTSFMSQNTTLREDDVAMQVFSKYE
jgi:hypothetical protein